MTIWSTFQDIVITDLKIFITNTSQMTWSPSSPTRISREMPVICCLATNTSLHKVGCAEV